MRNRPWLVFALVFAWKIALFVFTAQPVPANDAYFYDGAVIHHLLHGGYYNPCVARAFPISGAEIFSAYPPGYQLPLLLWMSVFGVSALSAMALHLFLFGHYLLVLLAIFRRLQVPAWCVNMAGGFLLVFTFHDRPDSFAHLLGVLAVYACVRSRRILGRTVMPNASNSLAPRRRSGARAGERGDHFPAALSQAVPLPSPLPVRSSRGEGEERPVGSDVGQHALKQRPGGSRPWVWLMGLFIVLAVCTSLQIGGIYFLVVSIATIAACRVDKEKIPLLPISLMVLLPVALVLLVRIFLPRAWAGFMENVHQTPFITGLRMPHWQEMMKIIRTVPGILVVTILLLLSWLTARLKSRSRREEAQISPHKAPKTEVDQSLLTSAPTNLGLFGSLLEPHHDFVSDAGRRQEIILLAALLPALGILAASLSILSPNTVAIANYLQPVIVAIYLGMSASLQTGKGWLRLQVLCLVPAILLGSVRAVGMSTWGVACAMDVSYGKSVELVRHETANLPPGSKVVMSSALMYAVSANTNLDLIHSDWMTRANGDSRISDVQALVTVRPTRMILTQYDYYRRFQSVLESAKGNTNLIVCHVENTAHTPAPDSSKMLQKVVQHVSWAPVTVDLAWRPDFQLGGTNYFR